MKYDFISSLEASNIKSYEVAVAMKYASHMIGILAERSDRQGSDCLQSGSYFTSCRAVQGAANAKVPGTNFKSLIC